MKPNNTKSKKEILASLRDANRETKSFCGCIKIIAKFWSEGYGKAFKFVNVTKEDLNLSLLDRLQKNTSGEVFLSVATFVKDENGQFVTDAEGKRKKSVVRKVVKTWTPTTLFKVLEQSI